MAITFSGEFTTPRNPDEVYDFLSDPNKFGPLLPDFQSMTVQDPRHFTVKVRVGVGNIRELRKSRWSLPRPAARNARNIKDKARPSAARSRSAPDSIFRRR